MRIGRYSKSFYLLNNAIREKRRELIVSMQFLIVVTVILSLMLFFAEHEAQPEVYKNGVISVIWAFAQYIGDPGQFADTPPITGIGRTIACIVGLLGIAIVVVPAGIIGSGFTEAIEKESKKCDIEKNTAKVISAFQRKLDRPSGYQTVSPFVTMTRLQAMTGIKTDEIINVINSDKPPYFRLINTASTIPTEEKPIDMLAVEHYVTNRSFGLLIDRGSKVTIINPAAHYEAGSGNFSFYLALIGGFNYISREIGDRSIYSSYFAPDDETLQQQEFKDYNADLNSLLSRPGSWSVTILVSSGALEPVLPAQLHFGIGGAKGQGFDMDHPLVKDIDTYRKLYDLVSTEAKEQLQLDTDHQAYHATNNKRLIFRLPDAADSNNVVLRIEWHKMLWDTRRMVLCRLLAEAISKTIEGRPLPDNPKLKEKQIGFDDYIS